MSPDDTLPPLPLQDGIEFRHVPGYPGYCAGDDGSLWSCRRIGKVAGILRQWRRLTTSSGKRVYRCVRLSLGGRAGTRTFQVHRVILLSFAGPCPPGMEACHRDGDPANCRLDNLRWDTPLENHADKRRHGTTNAGTRHPLHKLTEADVLLIRELGERGLSHREIAQRFRVSASTVTHIIGGKLWKHLLAGADTFARSFEPAGPDAPTPAAPEPVPEKAAGRHHQGSGV